MKTLFVCCGIMITHFINVNAQLQTKFQSVSSAGTSNGQATNGTLKSSGSFGQIVAFGSGQSNRAGFFVGVTELAPSTQATGITFSNFGSNQLTVSWTSGNGNRRIVLARATSAVNATPANGVAYTGNATLGLGTQVGTGNYTVYDGVGSSVTVTGLSPAVIYHFQVFEYNGAALTTIYKVTTATANPASQTTLASNASTQANSLLFSALTNTGVTLSWTSGNGARRIVLARQGSAVNTLPVSGQSYTANAGFGSGTQVTAGNYVVYDGSGSSVAVNSLAPNTTYHFQVFEYNGSGATSNYLTTGASNTAQKLTLTNASVASAATSITQTTAVANWSAVTGATSYSIDVSTDSFATFLTGYNNKSVVGILTTITGLAEGTSYQYRVRSNNASGTSANSNSISVLTIPATPIASAASPTAAISFTANWNAVTGADTYFIDVASDNGFVSMLTGYNNLLVATNSLVVTGLTAGTTYYYRVRSSNVSGTSPVSNVVSQVTIPTAPTGLAASSVGSRQFVVSWTESIGATSYEIEVSKESSFTLLLPGYDPLVSTDNTGTTISGLLPSTVYRYRIRAVNAGGKSAATIGSPAVGTLDDTGNSNDLSIDYAATPQSPTSIALVNGTAKITAEKKGGFGPITVSFHHRKITETTFTQEGSTLVAGKHEFNITSAMADELGVEFYFVATDEVGPVETIHKYVYNSYDASSIQAIPFAPGFNGTTATYQMFSIPYVLADKNVASVFVAMGAPNKKLWRLFHYQGGKNIEYPDNVTTIEVGKGYWFNTKQSTEIIPGIGTVVQANQAQPYSLPLQKGWTQIGNPFPFSISWQAVQTANPGLGLGSAFVYGGSGYTKAEGFKPWAGAFVFSETGGTLTIPVTTKCTGCRIQKSEFTSDLDSDTWQMPITLKLNDLIHESNIGMHPEAKESKDKFDEITVPRFANYLEMYTDHEEFFAPYFSTDIMPTKNNHAWEFTLSSNQMGTATIVWDQQALLNVNANLVLVDGTANRFISMKETGEYSFEWSEGRQIKIIFDRDKDIVPEMSGLGDSYPNPFNSTVIIPVLLHSDQPNIQIHIFDLTGRKVKTLTKEHAKAGVVKFEWNGVNEQGSPLDNGLYLYQLYGVCNTNTTKKLIKQ